MYILGLSNSHNATACLFKDGVLLGMVSEERFSRKKNHKGYPKEAVRYLLNEHGITAAYIDYVASGYCFGVLFLYQALEGNFVSHFFLKILFRFALWSKEVASHCSDISSVRRWYDGLYLLANHFFNKRSLKIDIDFLCKELGISRDKIIPQNHHRSHAAAAYYASPFSEKKSLVFVADGWGEGYCTSVDVMEGKESRTLARTIGTHSLGLIFHGLTAYLGMNPLEHEYKIMGLAPYARESDGEKLFKSIADWVTLDPKERLRFASKFDTRYSYRYIERAMRGKRFDSVAYAFQKLIEERMVDWVKEGVRRTGIRTVCCGGGVFMNVKMNMRIAELPEVDELYVMPSCSDESTPPGACYLTYLDWAARQKKKMVLDPLSNIYLGPQYDNKYVLSILQKDSFSYQYSENIEKMVAELLAQGKVVAVMRGKMEFGARALGNRSLLADPSKLHLVKEINEQVKKRDFWMPFAPTILSERADEYIVNPKKIYSPHMMIAFRATPLGRAHFAAAIHPYDLTMRPQILEEKQNSVYYKTIKEFEKITGIGGVLNTSFNLHGLPIVRGPEDALADFRNSGLEYLVLENYLVRKK